MDGFGAGEGCPRRNVVIDPTKETCVIANDRQYQQTRKKASGLEQLLASLHAGTAGGDGFRDLQIAGVESQLSDLVEELDEYDKLSGGMTTTIESSTLAGLEVVPDRVKRAGVRPVVPVWPRLGC
jgi:hypothetical protein